MDSYSLSKGYIITESEKDVIITDNKKIYIIPAYDLENENGSGNISG
jgi:methyltransferase-like protein